MKRLECLPANRQDACGRAPSVGGERRSYRVSQEAFLVTLCCLGAAAMRLLALENLPLWLDEYITFAFASSPVADLTGPNIRTEINPPVYYLLQKAWLAFGSSRFAMRTLPVFCSCLSVPAVYLIARRIGGRAVGLLAATLLITAPVNVHFAREIRCYSTLTLAATSALACLLYLLPPFVEADRNVLLARGPGRMDARTPERRKGRALLWTGYVISLGFALVLHNTGFVIAPLLVVFVLADAWLRRNFDPAFFRRFVAFSLLACLPLLAWVPIMWSQAFGPNGESASWIGELSLRSVLVSLLGAYPYPKWSKPLVYGFALLALWQLRKRPRSATFLAIFLLGQPLMILLGSLFKPMLLVRTLQWPTALFPVLLAFGLRSALKRPFLQLTGALLISALQLAEVAKDYSFQYRPGGAEAAARFLKNSLSQNDAILTIPDSLSLELDYEWRNGGPVGIPRFNANYADTGNQIGHWITGQYVARRDLGGLVPRSGSLWIVAEASPRFPIAPADNIGTHLEALRRAGMATREERYGEIKIIRVSDSPSEPAPTVLGDSPLRAP